MHRMRYAYADWRARYALHVPTRDQSDCVSFVSGEPRIGKVFNPADSAHKLLRNSPFSVQRYLSYLKVRALHSECSIPSYCGHLAYRQFAEIEYKYDKNKYVKNGVSRSRSDNLIFLLHIITFFFTGTVWSARLIILKSQTSARTMNCTPAIITRLTELCRCQYDGWPGSQYFW